MTGELRHELEILVRGAIGDAIAKWGKIRQLINLSAIDERYSTKEASKSWEPSGIPGYPFVSDDDPQVDDFIAMVVDMRESSKHLRQLTSARHRIIQSPLERVFYETSALLPAMARVTREYGGKVTEYLGDGSLGLFQATTEPGRRTDTIYKSFNAARDALDAVQNIINPALSETLDLPPLAVGIGLALSQAVVTPIGYTEFRQVKAFGYCVFLATKLSKGNNQIICDPVLEDVWPRADDGRLFFNRQKIGDFEGFVIDRK